MYLKTQIYLFFVIFLFEVTPGIYGGDSHDQATAKPQVTAKPTATTKGPTLNFTCEDGKVSSIQEVNIDRSYLVIYNSDMYCYVADTDCDWQKKKKKLKVMYVENESNVKIIAGRNAHYYSLECKVGFSAALTAKEIHIASSPRPSYNPLEKTEKSHDVSLKIEKNGEQLATAVDIGDTLQVIITGPASYKVHVLSCIGMDGEHRDTTYTIWGPPRCTSTDTAIIDGSWTMENNKASIQMYAFRFGKSSRVVIECTAYFCPSSDIECNKNNVCKPSRRRRRAADRRSHLLPGGGERTASATFTVADRLYESSGSSGLAMNLFVYITAFAATAIIQQK